MNLVNVIIQIAGLVLPLENVVASVALRIKSLLEVDPDITVAIKTADGDAFQADDATMAEVNTWRTSKGLPPLS